MTVVEAASQGAPSLVAAGGAVGATDLLSAADGECCGFDMEQPAGRLADEVRCILWKLVWRHSPAKRSSGANHLEGFSTEERMPFLLSSWLHLR